MQPKKLVEEVTFPEIFFKIPGYTVLQTIQEGEHFGLFRARRKSDQLPVLIKTIRQDAVKLRDITRLQNDFEMTQKLPTFSVLKVYSLEMGPSLILEDFGGHPLNALPPEFKPPMEVEKFLNLAIKTTDALSKIHRLGVIHKDIKPQNIFFNPDTGEIKIADFGLATTLHKEQYSTLSSSVLEATLPYMSPEQTGRTNRAIDSRTDLYSLGVTFYEMLTGQLPFHAKDPIEWIHCHVALTPLHPFQRIPSLPKIISAIVMKLLKKVPEERYQTAHGLKYDLETCLHQLRTTEIITPFVLCQRDLSSHFIIPQKLYKREKEIQSLQKSLSQVSSSGTTECTLVSGMAGAGKSALVHELIKQVTANKGFYVEGKFDQYQRDTPYSTLVQAFQSFVQLILTESNTKIKEWKQKWISHLGPNARVLYDVFPNLRLILGDLPPVPELAPAASQSRFDWVFQRFIQTLGQNNQPLVIFFDDMQWADKATLKWIESILKNEEIRNLFLLLAYRENGVDSRHPLSEMIHRLEKSHTKMNRIILGPLEPADVNQLLAETLHLECIKTEPLANLIHHKTNGNPFYVLEFMRTLYQEGILRFSPEALKWGWDEHRAQAKEVTENVVDLLVDKMRQLQAETLKAVQCAACMGNEFEIKHLARLQGKNKMETQAILSPAIAAALILPLDVIRGIFKFEHDRVQQAAYSLIPENLCNELHFKIGTLILSQKLDFEIQGKIFLDAVNSINHGIQMILETPEKIQMARYNLEAGLRTRRSNAYESAVVFLKCGMEWLGKTSWQLDHDLSYSLYLNRAECEYLTGHFETANVLFYNILENAKTSLEKAQVYNIKVNVLTTMGKPDKAIKAGLEGLKQLGVALPQTPTRLYLDWQLLKLKWSLHWETPHDLLQLPIMTDPHWKIVMSILHNMSPPAYFLNLNLAMALAVIMVNLSIKHGNTGASILGYAFYGVTLGSWKGDFRTGEQFGKLAIQLVQTLQDNRFNAACQFFFGAMINHWRNHLKTDFDYLLQSHRDGLEYGELSYAGYSLDIILTKMLVKGDVLEAVVLKADEFHQSIKRTQYVELNDILLMVRQTALCLMGKTKGRALLSTESYDEETHCHEMLNNRKIKTALHRYYIFKSSILFLLRNSSDALPLILISDKMANVSFGQIQYAEHYFYFGLILADVLTSQPKLVQKNYLKTLLSIQKKFKAWAKDCPENFSHKYHLISAEISRLSTRSPKNIFKIIDHYDQAIELARQNGFVQHEGIANELAAEFIASKGYQKIQNTYLQEAYSCYLRWGAKAKIQHLEEKYPQLFVRKLPQLTETFSGLAEQVDLISILKASHAISKEIVFHKLLETFMRIVVEQGGAQKGCLLLLLNKQFHIAAEAINSNVNVYPLNSMPTTNLPPQSILNYVLCTQEKVIANDSNRHIFQTKAKSALCIPILKQANLLGALYLENQFFDYSFTPHRLSVLTLLAIQGAVSLENAILYQKTQESVQVREEFLSIASHELKTPITPLKLQVQTLLNLLKSSGLILKGKPAQLAKTLLENADNQIDRLTLLAERLLDVTRLRSKPIELKIEMTNLSQLIQNSVNGFQPELERAHCTLDLQIEPEIHGNFDSLRIEEVLLNLLSNASKFGAGKPIYVSLASLQNKQMVQLKVQDHGVGIAKEDQERIFGFFERAASYRSFSGFGLGLYISSMIAKAHGGSLQVESEVGKGSTFIVELPLQQETHHCPKKHITDSSMT